MLGVDVIIPVHLFLATIVQLSWRHRSEKCCLEMRLIQNWWWGDMWRSTCIETVWCLNCREKPGETDNKGVSAHHLLALSEHTVLMIAQCLQRLLITKMAARDRLLLGFVEGEGFCRLMSFVQWKICRKAAKQTLRPICTEFPSLQQKWRQVRPCESTHWCCGAG